MCERVNLSLHNAFITEALFNSDTDKLHYQGKSKELIECEKLLNKLINPKMRGSLDDAISAKDIKEQEKYATQAWTGMWEKSKGTITNSKEMKKICELLKKKFGFAEMYIMVVPYAQFNAFTTPQNFLVRDITAGMPSLFASKKDYYDYDHKYYCFITLYTELFDGTFTADEIMALILHEIGHNFDTSVLSYVGDCLAEPFILYMCGSASGLKNWIVQRVVGQSLISRIMGYLKSPINYILDAYPIVAFFGSYAAQIQMFERKYLDVIDNVKSLLRIRDVIGGVRFMLTYNNPLYLAASAISNLGDVQKEVFSDSFATYHGYGAAMISAFNKAERKMEITTSRSELFNTFVWAGAASRAILQLIHGAAHPETQTRSRLVLDDMKRLSENKTLPPKIKNIVKKDYELAQKAYDTYLKVDPETKRAVASRFSNEIKDKYLFGKVDLRTYLTINSAIDSNSLK